MGEFVLHHITLNSLVTDSTHTHIYIYICVCACARAAGGRVRARVCWGGGAQCALKGGTFSG